MGGSEVEVGSETYIQTYKYTKKPHFIQFLIPGTFHSSLQVLEGKEIPDLVIPNAAKPARVNVKL